MTNKEIEEYRKRLVEIQKIPDSEQNKRVEALQKLAKEIGGSSKSWQPIGGENIATESTLVDHINDALRTATMINMCKTASRNFIIALIATVIALVSAVAAWVAALSR